MSATIRIADQVDVAAPVDQAWALLMDVPRVVPCVPGAELVEELGEDRWTARIRVKVGPMAMVFDADVERPEADAHRHTASLVVRAREQRGRGGAEAVVRSALTAAGDRTLLRLETEVSLSGRVAQFGRGAVVDVSSALTAKFAERLGAELEAAPPPPAPAVPAISLLLAVLRRRLRRVLGVASSGGGAR